MTCKDCINYDWCKDQTNNPDYYDGISYVENRCKGFKDNSQYIKLPCKVGDTERRTADVEPVRHGKWISVDSDVIFECSECGTEVSTSWDYDDPDMFTYCPNCGAKMDKED